MIPPVVIPPPPAESAATLSEPAVAAGLTDARIHVDAGFTGASVTLFGAVFNPTDTPTDVIVVVRGPDAALRLVRKHHVAGLWLNSRPVLFEGAPSYYATASTRPLAEIADFGQLRRLAIGLDHLRIDAPEESRMVTRYGVRDVVVSRLGDDYLDWRRAVVRLKTEAGLYASDPDGVRFVDRGLFRAGLTLPATAPTGRYNAQVWLFQEGAPVAVTSLTMTVEKVGLERDVYTFAMRRPWLYGLLSVLLAAGAGWLASRLFRAR
jgi:uncharacterized protein (TIGR02186 family)